MNTSWQAPCASLRTDGLNSTADDEWFVCKTAPIDDEEDTGCHPDEAAALKAYLASKTTSAQASRLITARISSAEEPIDHVYRLWALLCDALFELPEHTDALVELLVSIAALPDSKTSSGEEHGFWRVLPLFGHMWADEHKQGHWRSALAVSDPRLRSDMALAHVHKATVEAKCALKGVMPLDWGFEAVSDALEDGNAVWDFEVPAAAMWLRIAGAELRRGPEGRSSWALEKKGRLWTGPMTEDRWTWWGSRLREIESLSRRTESAGKDGAAQIDTPR